MPAHKYTPEERIAAFYAKIDRSAGPDSCWPWMAGRNHFGHGQLWEGSRKVLSHRMAYELTFGPIPLGMVICHRCDNPPCCNPAHLFLGTVADNNADRDAKGRASQGDAHYSRARPEMVPRGEAHGRSRLTETDVRIIRSLLASRVPQHRIAALFGIGQNTVSAIKTGKTWVNIGMLQQCAA